MSVPTDAQADSRDDQPSQTVDPKPGVSTGGGQPDGSLVSSRPVVPVALLTAHPGNVRRDLDPSREFVGSITENGVLVPLRITTGADGAYRVIDGHRRLAAAIQAGLADVPVDLADDRATDEPGQFLDMWAAHRHRNPLTPMEEADALFAAREAGATKARIRKSTGLKPPQVTAALAAATLSDETRGSVAGLPHELTLEGLAILAEFDDDPDAIDQLLTAARWHGTLDHKAERLRQERADQAEHQRLRHGLHDAGVTVTDALPPGGQLLDVLCHDGEELTPESHAACPGRGAFFRSYDPTTPVHYCADATAHGHSLRHHESGGTPEAAGAAGMASPADAPEHGPSEVARRLVIQGNKAWKAARGVRKCWLSTHLFPRRTAPREAAQFVTQQLPTMLDPLRSGLAAAHPRPSFAEITGKTAAGWEEACGTAAASRLPLLMLAPIITAYEEAMTEGDGKKHLAHRPLQPLPTPGSRTLPHLPGQHRLPALRHREGSRRRHALRRRYHTGDSLPDVTDGEAVNGATEPDSTDARDTNSPGIAGAASASDSTSSSQSNRSEAPA